MSYEETLEYLFTRLPMYQREGKSAFKKDLRNITLLLEALGNPQVDFKSIHIAGTNGKGTSAHGLASILQTAGYKTALYTSPHLKNFTERIKIDGEEIGKEAVIRFVESIQMLIGEIQPSFFEITVAMAFDHFARNEVEIAVIETGLGGRLDSTNVILPEISLITNIGFDHMDLLGNTLGEIAGEKAGIIKKSVPVVVGEVIPETKPIFDAKAKEMSAELIYAPAVEFPISASHVPNYLRKNFNGIHAVAELLVRQGWKIGPEAIYEGIRNMNVNTGLKGRFQVLHENPLIVADVSHNLDGLEILFKQIVEMLEGELHLIFGTVKDKDLAPILSLFPSSRIYWTQSSVPRALQVEELATIGQANGLEGQRYGNVNEAIQRAKLNAQPNDIILVTGSTFVVAEIADL